MSREPDFDSGRELGDGTPPDPFEAIVAVWRNEGDVPQWPKDGVMPPDAPPDTPPKTLRETQPDPATDPVDTGGTAPLFVPPPTPRQGTPSPAPRRAPEDDHFVPPEPPPLPKLGPPALVGIVLLVLGLTLVISPTWLGIPSPYGLPLGLLGLAAGLGWLVLRLWPDEQRPGDDDPIDPDDDGAIL
ncbi:hypothetical protein [Pseudonocardia sp. TRM90224]|uniref:hypothetical protein n=1 Tax=Pseudonocardia sp. TRM90224 TaxID=2812678 RepID=UPI001E5DE574|nr:hypothetical protein [Pseudonocardia sp. TRM90224]